VKAQEVRGVLDSNAARLRELHADIHIKVARRSKSDKDWQAWKDACALFHTSYDELAFPGGLDQAFARLKAGDSSLAEAAMIYCEIRPYYFRSGYHRSKFLRLLGRIPLTPDLASRLKAVKDEVGRKKTESRLGIAAAWNRRTTKRENEIT
jgi:hypothetical protein